MNGIGYAAWLASSLPEPAGRCASRGLLQRMVSPADNRRAAGKEPYTDDRLMSQHSASSDAPVDDRRILDELEQLHRAIRASRGTGERAGDAFEGELRPFETRVPPGSTASAVPAFTSPTNAGSSPAAANLPGRLTLPKPNPLPAVPPFDPGPGRPAVPRRSPTALIAGGIGVVVVASAGYVWTTQR